MQMINQSSRKRKELELLLEQVRARNGKNGLNKSLQPFAEKKGETYPDDIAIIGMAGRFPGSPDLVSFWQNLKEGKNLIGQIPQDRWPQGLADEAVHETGEPETPVKHIGALSDVFSFDAGLFGISPREAEAMDPHQRVLLEVVWETLEHAGYSPAQLSGTKTGVFIAMYNTDFLECSRMVPWEKESLPYLATGASQAIVSNRISYLFNWQGPSEIISTACSSALVGLHKAAQAIRDGDCEVALVGGVSLLLSPTRILGLSRLGILSQEGYCAPFDQDSPGEVLGEGAGAVLLKPLSQARQDGDTIYALLKASGTNHQGNSSGSITMPSVYAQRDLVVDTYRRAGIEPETIGFIEAHGSGNVSGDMAELVAFEKAFTSLSQTKQNVPGRHFCGIGSGKGNMGFLEAAGGMAQLIKVILSLQHKTLPATLNFKALPASINLENSPFYIVAKTIPWPALNDDNGQILPRRAAINSYGLGGTNAHIVVQEAPTEAEDKPSVTTPGFIIHPYLIVLSAQNEERLREVAKNLQHYMAGQPQVSPSHLQVMAYTLQVGRKAMKSRLAMVVDDADRLREKLAAFIAGEEKIERCYRGQVKPGADTFQANEAMRAVSQKNLEILAELWVKGWDIDWSLLYGPEKPHRISLPTYPFAKEWYGLPQTNVEPTSDSARFAAIRHSPFKVHPLVQQNISDLAEQRYRSVFSGEEFFWRDHQINGQKVLPGVAYLELARAAAELAGKQPVIQLKNIAWVRPLKVDGPAQVVSIVLTPTGEALSYKIETPTTSAENEWLLHGQGQVVFGEAGSLDPADRLDIAGIQSRCISTLQGTDCYRLFQEQGRHYGPGFQTIRELSYNDREVLARLQLPAGQGQEMRLSLGLMDGALQAIMGLYLNPSKGQAKRLELPFALARVNIYGDLPETVYAYVRRSQGSAANEAIVKYDIAMTDEQGEVRVCLKEFTMRTFSEQLPEQARGILYSTPEWQEKELVEAAPGAPQKINTLMITIGLDRKSAKFISTTFNQAQVLELPSEDEDTAATVKGYLRQVWQALMPLLEDNFSVQQVVVLASKSVQSYLYAPFIGLLKTTQLEHPKVQGKIIIVPAVATSQIKVILQKELQPDTFDDIEVRYGESGQREVKVLREIEPIHLEVGQRDWLKSGGVYWITGGLGGLGRIFARHLSEQGQGGLKIILSGRAALDEVRQQQLDELRGQGAEIQYLQVDVAQPEEVEQAFHAIKTAYGQLHGIIHAAGLVKEGLLRAKGLAEVDQVLAPKVAGVVNLDRVTKDEKLDFMVLFSSIASIAGHVKQWDYTASNAFLDRFGPYRQQLVEQGQRSGRTLVLNWSHWQDGGMQADEQALKLMKKLERITGMSSIETEEGLRAFDQAMAGCESQVVVAVGLKEKIRASLLAKDSSNSPFRSAERTPSKVQAELTPLREKVVLDLKKIVARLLKINLRDISEDEELQVYGFNSISFIAFVNVLNDLYGLELTPILVFEYNSLAVLSDYLLRHHQGFLVQHYQAQDQPQAPLKTRFRPAIAQVAATSALTLAPSQSSLVPLRSAGTRPPFFCVHPWAGMVYPYYALADELGPDQPFYGLQAVGLYQSPHRSIEEMAGHYLEALRTVQPAPPYLLGGWSLGGLIAFEMAQQLQRAGQEVALLALIDMPAPLADKKTSFRAFARFAIMEAVPYSWPYIRDYFQLMASVHDKSNLEAGANRLITWQRMIGTVAREVYSLTSPQTSSRRLLRTLSACMLAGSNYLPQPYPGRATLFRVQKQSGPDDEAQTMGWHKLVAQGVEVHHLPGHHFDILRQPQVQALAAQLRGCIDQVVTAQVTEIHRGKTENHREKSLFS